MGQASAASSLDQEAGSVHRATGKEHPRVLGGCGRLGGDRTGKEAGCL